MKNFSLIHLDPRDKQACLNELEDESSFKKLGTVRITDAGYTVNEHGIFSYHVAAEEPQWLTKINAENTGIAAASRGLILVMAEEIHYGDVFNIFIPRDPETVEYLDRTYNDGGGEAIFLIWQLESRTFGTSPTNKANPLISLISPLSNCPVCGQPLDYNEDTGELSCTNKFCKVFVNRDLVRYLNFAINLHGYDTFIRQLSQLNIINSAVDLYTPVARERSFQEFGKCKPVLKFWDALDRSMGKVPLSSWFKILPFKFNYVLVDDKGMAPRMPYMCPPAIDRTFKGNVKDFITFMDSSYAAGLWFESHHEWMQSCGSKVLDLMSIEMFYPMANLLFDEHDYDKQLLRLGELGIFKNT